MFKLYYQVNDDIRTALTKVQSDEDTLCTTINMYISISCTCTCIMSKLSFVMVVFCIESFTILYIRDFILALDVVYYVFINCYRAW